MNIQVVPYDPDWSQQFDREAAAIKEALGEVLVRIEHIGSTSVPGLAAKPIIDILLEVTNLAMLDQKKEQMENMAYEVMGEYGIPGRRYFRKGAKQRTHHVHAFITGDANLVRHLAFREYLKAHPSVAEAYAQLKMDIAEKCKHSLENYSDLKDPFIKVHEAKARAWYQARD